MRYHGATLRWRWPLNLRERDDYAAVKEALIFAQRSCCAICGNPLGRRSRWRPWLGTVIYVRGTIDHVWPRSLGGFDGPGNLVMTHRRCNVRKAARLPTGCEIIQLAAICAQLNLPVRLLQDPPETKIVDAPSCS